MVVGVKVRERERKLVIKTMVLLVYFFVRLPDGNDDELVVVVAATVCVWCYE